MKKPFPAGIRRLNYVASMAVLLGLASQSGCGGSAAPLPETYPATGKVLQADGTAMTGGLVEFQSTAGPAATTNGEIQPDGTFTLFTMVEGERLAGAIPGTYRVTIMPMMSDQAEEQHLVEPISPPQTYEVKADGPNEFTIELKKP